MRVLFSAGKPEPPEGLWAYLLDAERYLLGGALSNGGRFYTWLAKTLRLGPREELEEEMSRMRPDAHRLAVLPFLMGERSPGWRGEARAVIAGLSECTRPIDILRAGLEAVAYRFALIFERLLTRLSNGGHPNLQVIATGGTLLRSPTWMQILADVLNEPVVASREPQASSRGAALMVLESQGLIPSIGAVDFPLAETYLPDPSRHDRYRAAMARQRELYRRLLETG
ncbi:MAG: FGGY-family carbohydrate kinase [Armatimonadota bacterium]|nr:FGGY-family carbohydrate kinase [Armatimonadota bacterium]